MCYDWVWVPGSCAVIRGVTTAVLDHSSCALTPRCAACPTLQCVCEWRERGPLFVRLEREVRRDLAAGRLPPVQPFHIMAYPFPADLAKVPALVVGVQGVRGFIGCLLSLDQRAPWSQAPRRCPTDQDMCTCRRARCAAAACMPTCIPRALCCPSSAALTFIARHSMLMLH